MFHVPATNYEFWRNTKNIQSVKKFKTLILPEVRILQTHILSNVVFKNLRA